MRGMDTSCFGFRITMMLRNPKRKEEAWNPERLGRVHRYEGPIQGVRSWLLDLLGRRWTLRILREPGQAPAGFRDLQPRCERMSSSVLSTRLGELSGARMLTLHGDAYHLTQLGEDLGAGGGS
ncbi:winged helix-turn-helix transcriptional regulator [Streptomyces sp. NPDC094438]|uniref:winged helix-turn-helix transcriptional regulator n=1 Tax=Streptomyces sp. NPDC094438 TaxID=3366061 RepID=UPI00381FFD6F